MRVNGSQNGKVKTPKKPKRAKTPKRPSGASMAAGIAERTGAPSGPNTAGRAKTPKMFASGNRSAKMFANFREGIVADITDLMKKKKMRKTTTTKTKITSTPR